MKTRATPAARRSLRISSTCTRLAESSALTGSSRMISCGLGDQRAGDGDALALAAGELAGQPVEQVVVEADPGEVGAGRRSAASARTTALDEQRLGQRLLDA